MYPLHKFYTLEEMMAKHIDPVGTPEREAFDAEVEAALIGASTNDAPKAQIHTPKEISS